VDLRLVTPVNMSSDGYFEGEIDGDILEQLDAIEAAHFSPKKPPLARPPVRQDSSFDEFNVTFDIDDSELQRLDTFIEDAYQGKAGPVAGQSKLRQPPNKCTVQTTLFGGILPNPAPRSRTQSNVSSSRTQTQHSNSTPRNPFGQQAPKTKTWDRTAFAKSGVKSGKGKGKALFNDDNDEEQEDDEVEFEQFPAPFVSSELLYIYA
jgi:ATP-dependent DNA helicase MPH1